MALVRPLTKPGVAPTDAALVVASRAGDRRAQEALFRRHVPVALGLAHRILLNDSEVDDLVQDSFMYAFERLATLENPQAFAAWLCSIVVRTASKRLRRRRLLARLGIRQHAPADLDQVVSRAAPPDVGAELCKVYGLLDRLPAEERIALVLRKVEGLEVPQIAGYMGLSISTVKRRLDAAEVRLERARR